FVGGYRAAEDVTGPGRYLFGRGPRVVGARAQEHAIRAVTVGDPGRGNGSVRKRRDGRLIVLVLRGGELFRAAYAHHRGAAVQDCRGRILDVFQGEIEVALGGLDGDARNLAGANRQVDTHGMETDVGLFARAHFRVVNVGKGGDF